MKKFSVKTVLILFILLAGINLLLFNFRDHFAYVPYTSYQSLYKPCDEACRKKWQSFVSPYDPRELQEAQNILASEAGIKSQAFTINKVLAIASFEYVRFSSKMGKPRGELAVLPPLQQFKQASLSTTERLWCGNLAAIFAFFCWSEGITCRYVEIFNPGNHHVVNECFIPELNQWVMVDITNNILLSQDKSAKYLNLQQFIEKIINKDGVRSYRLIENKASKINLNQSESPIQTYYSKKNPVFYFHSLISESTYSPTEKLKRYFLPFSWYDVYDANKGGNLSFYGKIILFSAWVVTGILLVVLFLQNRNHDRSKKYKEEL